MWRVVIGELRSRRLRGSCAALAAFMIAVSAAGCGGDTFGPDDAGTAGSTPDAPGAEESKLEAVIEVCTKLCQGQIEGGCHLLTNPEECPVICNAFKSSSVSAACRDQAKVAFDCQLPTPCSTKGCNDLLKAAEAACPKIPFSS